MKRNSILFILLVIATGLYGQVTVTGKVTSSNEEEGPLIGVNIRIKGTDRGAITDIDGNYELEVPSADTVLLFSYTGYEPQEIALNGRTTLNVELLQSSEMLEEVVVVGYGTQRKSDLTGSISSLESEEINRVPSANVEQLLQGKVAGVQVTPISGKPGEGAVVRIRGTGTLNNASPLYVVDGMLLNDISFLNPQDIESMEVLKDASATAIYGSRGANGVIIITTKKGAERETQFNVSSYGGLQEVITQIDLTNGRQFATLANEVATNVGNAPPFDDPDAFGEGTNWQDVIFQTAPIQSHQISANGGNENILFNISANYFKQEGIVRGSDFWRATLRLNNQYKLTDRVEVGHNIAFTYREQDNAANVVPTAYRADPTIPVFDSTGNFTDVTLRNGVGNAEASIFYNNNFDVGNRIVGNAYADFNFLENFTLKTSFGVDLNRNENKNFTPEFEVSPNSLQRSERSSLTISRNETDSWVWENTLTYNNEWGDHRLTVLGGATLQEFISDNLSATRFNFIGESEEFFFLNAGSEDGQINSNDAFEWSILSFLSRVNYVWKDRYLLTASIRADGSSKFGENNRYGYFPSVALGWNLSREPFFDVDFISRLKLRGSWGQVGNEKIGAYQGRPRVESNVLAVFGANEAIQNGATITELANPDIQWEETSQSNIGFELGLLEGRFSAEIDYYTRTTDQILVSVPIPDYVGASAPVVNAAEVRNRGVDLNLSWRDRIGDFSYNFNFVGSTVNNEVLSLGQGREEILGGGLGVGGQLGTRTAVGQPIGYFFGFEVDGIFQNEAELEQFPTRGGEVPGDLRFADLDGDGAITTADKTFLGSPIPDFTYGFGLGAEYRGFDLQVDFNGQSGNEIINAKRMSRFATYNFETIYLDRWTEPGSSTTEPRITNGGHNYQFSERFVQDGSFLRLRTVQIGYTLPANLLDKINFNNLRIYFNGTNLVTWTDYTGYTPEISSGNVLDVGIDRGVFPIAKTYTFGVDLRF